MLPEIIFPLDMLPDILQRIGKIFSATWGFKSLIKDSSDIKTLLPLIIISTLCILITIYQIKKINL